MKIDVRINTLNPDNGSIKAIASANFDDCLAVKNIKVMEGKKGLFISMPSYKGKDSEYHDICFPTTAAFRTELNSAVEQAYHQAITQLQEQAHGNFTQSEEINESAPTMSM